MIAEQPPTPAERAIRRRIARHGPITFAEFMAAALYGPGGYYMRQSASVDYYTSPRVHPAFGALLAIQLFHCWDLLGRPAPYLALEPGAGDGLLGRDILSAAKYLPHGFADTIQYIMVDRRATPGLEHALPNVTRISADILDGDASAVIPSPVHCVLSNELLDAFPVNRVRQEGGRLRELYVDVESDVADGYEGVFVEVAGELSNPSLRRRLDDLGIRPADGQTAEICPHLDRWADTAAGLLESGFLLTIDYGRLATDLYDAARRPNGTLVTYRDHRQTDTPLHDVGRQDITAQVDFTSLQRAGDAAGLDTIGLVPQGWFLQRLGLQTLRRNAAHSTDAGGGWISLPVGPDGMPPDTVPEVLTGPTDDRARWLSALSHLAEPDGLGDFRVLAQSRGVSRDVATDALAWLNSDPSGRAYTPSALAAMIPAEALNLGPEYVDLTR